MSTLIDSSPLNNDYINVTFLLENGQNICAQVRQDFELDDLIKVIRNKLDVVAVDECCFFLNNEELLLGDKASFQAHKDLVTNGCIITVVRPSVDDGEGYVPANFANLSKAWTNKSATPDPIFTDFQPVEATSKNKDKVNFFPVERKGTNYLRYCTGWLRQSEKPASIKECVWKYTSGPGWFCTTINLALATDSPDLQNYSEYIKHLKYSIGISPMNYTGIVYRGQYQTLML